MKAGMHTVAVVFIMAGRISQQLLHLPSPKDREHRRQRIAQQSLSYLKAMQATRTVDF